MRITGVLRGECDDGKVCPRVLDTEDPEQVLVQGDRVTDLAVLEQANLPPHEALVRVPRTLITGARGSRLMPRDEFSRWYDEHLTRDMLRLETLDYYHPDAPGFARWQRREHEPDWPAKRPWLDRVRADHEAGITRRRVRIVRGPLTEYVRFECQWGYVPLGEHGEDIRILDLTETGADLAEIGDFSVFDHTHVIFMHYDADGAFLGATVVEQNPEYFVALRDLLWHLAAPFPAWWARHPEHHRKDAYPE